MQANLDKGIFVESQEEIVFPGEKYGLHTRVFINHHGLPTYEAKELGLAPTKYQDFPFDRSIIITGNEIDDYFKVLLAALKQVAPRLVEVTTHIGHGMVRLPEGKMSSRTGQVITGDTLLDQAHDQVLEIIYRLNPQLPEKEVVADQVGIAAIKYAFLKSNLGSDVTFRFADALSFTGQSGPRGSAPLITVAVAVLALGEQPSALAVAGAVLIATGAFLLTGDPRRLRESGNHHAVGFALLTGCMIASYTVVDKLAVAAFLVPPLVQDWAANLGRVALMTPLAFRQKAELMPVWRRARREIVGVAILCPVS